MTDILGASADADRAFAAAPSSPSVSPVPASIPSAARLSKDERSFILYAESCCVDAGGLLVGERMNSDDHDAARMFVENGFMFFGRMPAALLRGGFAQPTHWCELTLAGWELAWQCRRDRSLRRGPLATDVFEHPVTLRKLAEQMPASGMSAGTAETAQQAQGEARQPDGDSRDAQGRSHD